MSDFFDTAGAMFKQILDAGYCLPAIGCASGAGRRGYWIQKEFP
jgi:hypothetical protein